MIRENLDRRIEALCKERGLAFKPWELPPWMVGDGACPKNCSPSDRHYWPQAQALRRKLIAELRENDRARRKMKV